MFRPWIRKKALKRRPRKGKHLVIDGERPSVVALVAVAGLLVALGVFVLQHSLAAPPKLEPTVWPVAPTETPSPTPINTSGPY
jgi:hypothetical protein